MNQVRLGWPVSPRRWRLAVALVAFLALAACAAPTPTALPPATASQTTVVQPPTSVAPPTTAPTAAPAVPATTAPTAPPTAPPTASAVQPKRGGTLVIGFWITSPPDLDPYLNVAQSSQELAGWVYSRLLKFDTSLGIKANSFIPTGDLADKWDVSKDGLTYTFHIRDNAKWQNKPPLNGRKVTADDVVYSWTRFQKENVQRSAFTIVKELKKVDDSTVAFVLNDVYAPFETMIAQPIFWIIPKEVVERDGNLRTTIVGSGPFIFDRFEKGVQVVVKRNPDYYFSPMPYIDEADLLILPETATALAGLRSKQIDILTVFPADRNPLAKSNPEIKIIDFSQNAMSIMYWKVNQKPFDDVRVRQAVSLALDREESAQSLAEGHAVWNTAIAGGLSSWWLDPRSPNFGPNAKYFKRDVAAAKKLLADAGYPNGLKAPMITNLTAYGNTFNQGVDLVIRQLKDVGIEVELKPQDYAAYVSTTYAGKFDGGTMVWGLYTPSMDPNDYLTNMYDPKSPRNLVGVNDPKLNDMIAQQRKMLDRTERKKLIDDIQRYLAEQMYYVPGTTGDLSVAIQPWVKDFILETDFGRGAEFGTKLWLDNKPTQ